MNEEQRERNDKSSAEVQPAYCNAEHHRTGGLAIHFVERGDMGCDIHAHLEIKVDGDWMYYGQANVWRNYTVFARMADVRNYDEIESIAAPRGLPTDATPMTMLHREYYGRDRHSDSWLSYEEFVELIDWLEASPTMSPPEGFMGEWEYNFLGQDFWLFGSSVYGWQEYPENYPESIEDIRLVFWFDD